MNERTQTMARLYVEEGLTYTQIGERYGISRQRVHALLGPLDLATHRGVRYLKERHQILTDAHARITEGESSTTKEAERLGYASAESLRKALWRVGLRTPHKKVELVHGLQGYRRKCRCEVCTEAHRIYMRGLKEKEAPNHGTVSGYRNYACRCQACKEAERLEQRARRQRQRQQEEVEA
jgi:hypothetical protein